VTRRAFPPRTGHGDGRPWSPEVATARARRAGLPALRPRHWKVIAACREEAARTGRCPRLERLSVLTGLAPPELLLLFPGEAEALVARIAGLGRSARGPRRHGRGSSEE